MNIQETPQFLQGKIAKLHTASTPEQFHGSSWFALEAASNAGIPPLAAFVEKYGDPPYNDPTVRMELQMALSQASKLETAAFSCACAAIEKTGTRFPQSVQDELALQLLGWVYAMSDTPNQPGSMGLNSENILAQTASSLFGMPKGMDIRQFPA